MYTTTTTTTGDHSGHEHGDGGGDAAQIVHEERRGQGAGQPDPSGEGGDQVQVRDGRRQSEDPARHRAADGGEQGEDPADRDGRLPQAQEQEEGDVATALPGAGRELVAIAIAGRVMSTYYDLSNARPLLAGPTF